MIAVTASMEIVTTHTEVEALLLESNLIKQLKPRYNVLLRDDKSFPYILLTGENEWPQLIKHRGAKSRKGEYFGPFASAGAVNRTLAAFQRIFPLRNCSDGIFRNRTRPCLQYQIKRCTAPCVGRISREDYGEIVGQARDFLRGKSTDLQRRLSELMDEASENLEFEAAAIYRDRIRALTQIQARQDINISNLGEADVIAAHSEGGLYCVQVFFFRSGQNYGSRTYFPRHTKDVSAEDVMEAFVAQFYDAVPPPAQILVSHLPKERDLLSEALAVRAGRKVEIAVPSRGTKRSLIDRALDNAREALSRHMSESSEQRRLLDGLADLTGVEGAIGRVEVYDNSHIQGSNPVGGMIVSGPEGFVKKAYRKFNIRSDVAPGDDFGMMREVLNRRFSRAMKEDPDRSGGEWPDLILIDGGQGQLSAAEETLADLGVDDVSVAAVSKGPDRNAGREQIHMTGKPAIMLRPDDPLLYFIQRLRDEAHRFAIGSHRARRSKGIAKSPLDEVPGVGGKRKRALLHHFGSAAAVSAAGLADLEAVEGISKGLAKKIYDHFHASG
jgi:excinuclease ABC subunit C